MDPGGTRIDLSVSGLVLAVERKSEISADEPLEIPAEDQVYASSPAEECTVSTITMPPTVWSVLA